MPRPREDAQLGLEAIIVTPRELLTTGDIGDEAFDLADGAVAAVAPVGQGRGLADSGERRHQVVDGAIAVERFAAPRRRKVSPLHEVPRRTPQAAARGVSRRAATSGLTQCTAYPGSRVGELALEPALENAGEVPARNVLGRHLELWIDSRLHRPLAQQLGAERVDGADACDLELGQRLLEPAAFV